MRFDIMPNVLVFSVSEPSIQVSKKVSFHDGDSLMVLVLKGLYIMVIFIILLEFAQMDLSGSMMAWCLAVSVYMTKD